MTEENKQRIRNSFQEDGYVLCRKIIPAHVSQEWKEFSNDCQNHLFRELHQRGITLFPLPSRIDENGSTQFAMKTGLKNGYREIVMRSPGRYELSLTATSESLGLPLPSLIVIKEALWFVPSLLEKETWDDINICHVSLVLSVPNSREQAWHADGGHVCLHEHLPCHCFNIFIPLVAVTEPKGPTELRPGTHFHTRNLAPMMLAAKARKTLRSPVLPILSEGDVLIFDYRLLHRGKANVSKSDRPVLVLTVAKSWFKDVLNFPTKSFME